MSTLTAYKGQSLINLNTSAIGLLDIDRIKANPIYQCTISGGRFKVGGITGLKYIKGIYNSDAPFSISCGSEWSDTFELPGIFDKINETSGFLANMSGKTQFILKSLAMTEKRWSGATSPTFNIRIDIPIIRKTDAPWTMIKFVLQSVMGTLNDYNGQGQIQRTESAWQIFAPNGYKIQYSNSSKTSDKPEGTYSISLGTGSTCWFQMLDAVITNVNCSIGNKKYYDGNPTSISVDIQFEYWRMPLLEDIITWFPLSNSWENPF